MYLGADAHEFSVPEAQVWEAQIFDFCWEIFQIFQILKKIDLFWFGGGNREMGKMCPILDRKSVGKGKSVDLGVRRIFKKKKEKRKKEKKKKKKKLSF